jgi:hypothetical protein
MGEDFFLDLGPLVRWDQLEEGRKTGKLLFVEPRCLAEGFVSVNDPGFLKDEDPVPDVPYGFQEDVVQKGFQLVRYVQGPPPV